MLHAALTILYILLPPLSSDAIFPSLVDTVGSLGHEDDVGNHEKWLHL
jgi:hypothetical protein